MGESKGAGEGVSKDVSVGEGVKCANWPNCVN